MTLKTPPRMVYRDPIADVLALVNDGDPEPVEHAPGIVQVPHWNPDMLGYKISTRWNQDFSQYLHYILDVPEFGVCDSPQQFLDRYGKVLEDDQHLYAVFMVHVRKDTQDPKGGWRWHKWGEYVGTGEPTTEYLYDEPGFPDGVWTFHVYEVTE